MFYFYLKIQLAATFRAFLSIYYLVNKTSLGLDYQNSTLVKKKKNLKIIIKSQTNNK